MLLFRRFRHAIPVGLVALLLALIFMGTSSTPTDNTSQVNLSDVQEDAVKELYDSSGAMINPDRQMQSIAKDNAGGYGGHYFDDDDPSTVYVYMTDVTETAAAEAAFRAAQREDEEYTNVVVLQGQYSMADLVDWFYQTLQAFNRGGVDVNGAGLHPADNGFTFKVGANDGDRAWAIIDELGVPRGAVTLQIGGGWTALSNERDSVRAEWRPIVGGIQIQRSSELCTIGFTTIRDNVRGMITASHCTNNSSYIGGDNNANFHQPDTSHGVAASETIDPNLYAMNHDQCDGANNCRYTDSVFSEKSSSADIDRGKIAKPQSLGSTSVSPAGNTWDISHESYPVKGRTVYFVGRDRGWRQAKVDTNCELIELNNAKLVCMATAKTSESSDRPRSGDSGGPVFELSGGRAKLVGIISAKDNEDSKRFSFSKTGAIYTDLGLHSTWDSCASGC